MIFLKNYEEVGANKIGRNFQKSNKIGRSFQKLSHNTRFFPENY